MADTLRIKRRAVGGAAGAPTSLAAAEIAYNEQDDTLYYGKGNSGGAATAIIPIAGPGAFQAKDADLTSLASASSTGVIYYRSAADTWGPVTIGTGLSFSSGTLSATGGGGGGIKYTESATAPSSPVSGDLWYDLSTGVLSVRVNDGNSSQWVTISPNAAIDPTVFAKLDSPIFIGDARAVTPTAGDADTSIATTAFVMAAATHNNLINGKIVESHAGNIATFSVKTLSGADPSSTNVVGVSLPDGSVLMITAALSFSTSTQTLGVNSTVPFRLWFAVGSNAGTPVLMARNCSASNGVSGFDARGVTNTAVVGNSAFATYAASALSNIPYKVVAFADYESGLATTGVWAVSPTRIIQVGPQTPLPGSPVQTFTVASAADTTTTSSTYQNTPLTITVTPTSPINLIQFSYSGNAQAPNANSGCYTKMHRGTTPIGNFSYCYPANAGGVVATNNGRGLDRPGTTSATTYTVKMRNDDNAQTVHFGAIGSGGGDGATMLLTELMG